MKVKESSSRVARAPWARQILVAAAVGVALWAGQPSQSTAADAQIGLTPQEVATIPARPAAEKAAPNRRARMTYIGHWGIDELRVRTVSSGSMLEFRYLVVDKEKAKPLAEKRAVPTLTVQRTGAKLIVATMEKIGTLRQVANPENGKEYFMMFQNQGRQVKSGDLVDVAIGEFHARGLRVE